MSGRTLASPISAALGPWRSPVRASRKIRRRDLEGLLNVDLTRSPNHWGMAAICAFRPKTGVDVKGHCGSRRWTSWGKLPLGAADSLANERPALIFRSLGGFRWVDGGF